VEKSHIYKGRCCLKAYRVLNVTSGKATVEDEHFQPIQCYLRGKYKQYFKRNLNFLRVGDFVTISKDGNTYCVEKVLPRTSKFSRAMPNYEQIEQVLAANVDQVIMINAFTNPEFKFGLIDRYTVLAEKNNLPITICFNKADLVEGIDTSEITDIYSSIGYNVLVTSIETGEGIEEFKALLSGSISVVTGHSGVGKSSLINKIAPELEITTQEVSDYNEKGQHTTTLAEFHRLDETTAIIDTPGIKEFALWDIEKEDLHMLLPDFKDARESCKFYNCTHRHEPKCGVRKDVEDGVIEYTRYENYLHMFTELEERELKRYK